MNIETQIKQGQFLYIPLWMRTKLDLDCQEMNVYSLIYGFSKDGTKFFTGSRNYIADVVGIRSLKTVDRILTRLLEKNLICKKEVYSGGVKYNSYRALIENLNFETW